MRPQCQRGFTLLEVLVALAILALALGALIRSGGQSAETLDHLRNKTLAQWIAGDQATRLQLERAWPEARDHHGEVAMAGRNWQWRMAVHNTADGDLRRVEISVFLDGVEAPLTRLVTLLTHPHEAPRP